jgi:CTP-dependent riboflavin kinase
MMNDAYRNKIEAMSDEDLLKETSMAITNAATENSLRLSDHEWDDKTTACFREWIHRGKGEFYTVAYRKAFKEAVGYEPREVAK